MPTNPLISLSTQPVSIRQGVELFERTRAGRESELNNQQNRRINERALSNADVLAERQDRARDLNSLRGALTSGIPDEDVLRAIHGSAAERQQAGQEFDLETQALRLMAGGQASREQVLGLINTELEGLTRIGAIEPRDTISLARGGQVRSGEDPSVVLGDNPMTFAPPSSSSGTEAERLMAIPPHLRTEEQQRRLETFLSEGGNGTEAERLMAIPPNERTAEQQRRLDTFLSEGSEFERLLDLRRRMANDPNTTRQDFEDVLARIEIQSTREGPLITQLQEERDSLPLNDPRRDAIDGQIQLLSTRAQTDKQREIASLERQYSEVVDPQTARDWAENKANGLMDIVIDPVTGRALLRDEVNNRVSEVPIELFGDPEDFDPRPLPGQSLWELSHLATGPVSGILAGISRAAGIFGGQDWIANATLNARTQFRSSMQTFLASLALNPRFPQGEMDRLKAELDIEPALFDNPDALWERLIAIDQTLFLRSQQSRRDSLDGSLPREIAVAQEANATRISNFLMTLNAPASIARRHPSYSEMSRLEQAEFIEEANEAGRNGLNVAELLGLDQ